MQGVAMPSEEENAVVKEAIGNDIAKTLDQLDKNKTQFVK